MKKIINITDITEFLYCPRKVYLRLVKGIRTPPNQRMINGMLRHKVFDLFNKNEKVLVESIKIKIPEKEIKKLYETLLINITKEVLMQNQNLAGSFGIDEKEFSNSISKTTNPEINLRVSAVSKTLEKGFLGKELWRNLKPKYLTEYRIESQELGLRGRIDRIMFSESPIPIEIKTREKIYDSDKIQLAGYALLLEKEFNKNIGKGAVEYLGKREDIELTEELKNQVLEIAEKIRNMTEENASFPSNFEKCKSCALKENCN